MGLSLFAAILFGFGLPAPQSADCLACHSDKTLQDQAGHSVYVDEDKRKSSVHGNLACNDCHTDIKEYPHPKRPSAVSCGVCHSSEAEDVDASIHSKVSAQPCVGCHGDPHGIVPVKDPGSPVYPLNIPRTCGSCHGNPEIAKRFNLPNVYAMYMDSIHGFALTKYGLLVAATCASCHGTHKILSHTNPDSRTYRTNIPATCGSCHAGPEAQYFAGVHGKAMRAGNSQAPVCSDCHTAHQISNVRLAAWQVRTTATCGNCHRERFATYHDTFHAQVSALGYVETARCWDCHAEHQILPASDPNSPVAKANLVTTCRKCHSGATESFASYQPHANPRDRKSYPALYFTAQFMNLLLLSVLGFFVLHTILWFIRSTFDRPAVQFTGEASGKSKRK
ncbi:MAG TPA: cytochrome c3 family protein [Candidatus Acidoferrales bacterium]|nr:cytochrome c3 family protein [Candidatus Acidoferrales bacterium]